MVIKMLKCARRLWLVPAILVTWEAEIRKIRFRASPGKEFERLHFQPQQNGLEVWFKQQSTCFAEFKPQSPPHTN
jgi:hypothetical protein